MDINKNNYEAWLLDYFEGALDAHQVGELLLFAEQHPELDIDLDEGFDDLGLEPEAVPFVLKDDLKREEAVALVNEENYEDYLVAEMEGVIEPQELLALNAFISTHPAVAKEQVVYGKLRLEANSEMIFANKGDLKKKRALVIPMFVRFAAAAAVALFILFFWPKSKDGTEIHVATTPIEQVPHQETKGIDQDGTHTINEVEGLVESEGKHPFIPKDLSSPKNDVVIDQAPMEMAGVQDSRKDDRYITPTPILPVDIEQGRQPIQQDPIMPDSMALDMASNQMDSVVDTVRIAAPTTTVIADMGPAHVTEEEALNVWQYVGMKIKTGILDQEDVADGTLRENDVANALGKGIDKITNKDVRFKDKSKEKRTSYGFQIGKFGFSRSTSKK